ncbi:MAG TPA: ABC transporter ATP-binding protein [Polyangiaceae bacterium]|nr:ABC transporter ATP-binding protein [Polyangiaceae bacterium]
MSALLSVRNLVTSFRTDAGQVRAVDGVSFEVAPGSTLGIVGESGCGKTVAALSILRLVPAPAGSIEGGEVLYGGQNLLTLDERDMRAIRGRKISMIFQEPMTSLNPVYSAGHQIAEVIRLHQKASATEAKKRSIEMLRLVGIASPEARFDAFPHEMSAGMRQRVMIAMALACEPELLIADEPTTALDVTIQAQILDLLRNLQDKMKMSIVLITHDLGVVAEFAQELVVMYAGRVVEQGAVKDVLTCPRHPYTEGLLRSVAALGQGRAKGTDDRLARLPTIPGAVPELTGLPPGCRFSSRCSYVEPKCKESEPPLAEVDGDIIPRAEDRRSRCFFSDRVGTS